MAKHGFRRRKKNGKFSTFLALIVIVAIIVLVVYGYNHGWFDAFLPSKSDSVEILSSSVTIKVGDTKELQFKASGTVTWESSNTAVATVEEAVVTAVSKGTATITATCGEAKATCQVNVAEEDGEITVVQNSDLSIHFLEVGNSYTGDCVYIKAGDTDILIDAGSRQGSAATIAAYVDQYCTDGILEYVIATHAHQDHIAGFVGTKAAPGIFAHYECKTIIQFARTEATSQVYKNYCTERDKEVEAGAKLFTALECYNESKEGAQRVYDLTGDGAITMEILYQRFYVDKSSESAGGENDYSVCVMITQGENHYLLTGDLEKDGEASLVQSNPDLPEMVLFKGGHHGSYTASSSVLLNKIKPQYVCVCCCAGTFEYASDPNHTFPAQEFVDRIAPYTDRVYVTTLGIVEGTKTKGFTSMNGNIVFRCTNGEITMTFSNNDTKLKDTEWFQNNRTMPEAWANGTSMYK